MRVEGEKKIELVELDRFFEEAKKIAESKSLKDDLFKIIKYFEKSENTKEKLEEGFRQNKSNKPLHRAVLDGEIEKITSLLSNSNHFVDDLCFGETAIRFAYNLGSLESAKLLLASGADPQHRNRLAADVSSLHLAMRGNNPGLIGWLMQHGSRLPENLKSFADLIDEALLFAATETIPALLLELIKVQHPRLKTYLKLLFDLGVGCLASLFKDETRDMRSYIKAKLIPFLMGWSIRFSDFLANPLTQSQLSDWTYKKTGRKIGHFAAVTGRTDILSKLDIKLLEHQDHRGNTPIDHAIFNRHLKSIKHLLVLVPSHFSRLDSGKRNLLHKAALVPSVEIIRYLLAQNDLREHKLDLHARDNDGSTAFSNLAASVKAEGIAIECMREFLRRDPTLLNWRLEIKFDQTEQTVLHIAASYNCSLVIRSIQELDNRNPEDKIRYPLYTKNPKGITPLHYAVNHGHIEATQCLIERYHPELKQEKELVSDLMERCSQNGYIPLLEYLDQQYGYPGVRTKLILKAAACGWRPALRYFYQKGYSFDVKDEMGCTVYHLFAMDFTLDQSGMPVPDLIKRVQLFRMMQLISQEQIDRDSQNVFGQSPCDIAVDPELSNPHFLFFYLVNGLSIHTIQSKEEDLNQSITQAINFHFRLIRSILVNPIMLELAPLLEKKSEKNIAAVLANVSAYFHNKSGQNIFDAIEHQEDRSGSLSFLGKGLQLLHLLVHNEQRDFEMTADQDREAQRIFRNYRVARIIVWMAVKKLLETLNKTEIQARFENLLGSQKSGVAQIEFSSELKEVKFHAQQSQHSGQIRGLIVRLFSPLDLASPSKFVFVNREIEALALRLDPNKPPPAPRRKEIAVSLAKQWLSFPRAVPIDESCQEARGLTKT